MAAPKFAEFLRVTPEVERHGRVPAEASTGTIRLRPAQDSCIGHDPQHPKKAGVKVNADTGKCASAHDLRRAFGQRWAARVMPQILMQLMRHEDISTTMKFYVGKEAEATADVLWAAVAEQGNKRGNTRRRKVKN